MSICGFVVPLLDGYHDLTVVDEAIENMFSEVQNAPWVDTVLWLAFENDENVADNVETLSTTADLYTYDVLEVIEMAVYGTNSSKLAQDVC